MRKCIIVGAGTYGQVYSKYLADVYDVLGYVDDNESLQGSEVCGHKVFGPTRLLWESDAFDKESTSIFVPIGKNTTRSQLLNRLQQSGYDTPSFIHHTATVDSSVQMEAPVYILPQSNIMPYTRIAKHVMISMGVNIAHHVDIREGCFFSQGTNIGASLCIEAHTYIGISATVMTGVKRIGSHSLIGAGSVVIRDVPDNVVVAGVPGKILKPNTK